MRQQVPQCGQMINVRGVMCKIVKLRPLGTLDAQAPDGRTFRVSGLPFTLCRHCGDAKPYGAACGCVKGN